MCGVRVVVAWRTPERRTSVHNSVNIATRLRYTHMITGCGLLWLRTCGDMWCVTEWGGVVGATFEWWCAPMVVHGTADGAAHTSLLRACLCVCRHTPCRSLFVRLWISPLRFSSVAGCVSWR